LNWPEEYFREQAELVLDMFDLTSEEVDEIVAEWNRQIGEIPENWYDETPYGFGDRHALGKLQSIAQTHVLSRRRS
jgi:hypothetical protein